MNFLGEPRSQQCALALTVDQAMRLAAFPSTPRLPSPRCSPSRAIPSISQIPNLSILVRLLPQLDALRAHTAETQPQLRPARALELLGTRARHPRPRRHKAPTARASHAARLSAPALHLPTPRATS